MKRYRRCSRGYRWLFTFLLLNQEHGVNNERSQSIQSVRHSKRTHRMWPLQKDSSTRSWQTSIYVHAWRSDTVTDQRFSTAASILKSWTYICQYIDQIHVWNDVLPRGTSLFRIISPVISGNHLLSLLGERAPAGTSWAKGHHQL